ncbi:hypothetical protein [Agrobacterium tumefaciens]|uniref:hypothetical protein n=1 Tax=Agrobacterium tumefaciens TaxID=358 RepID=UPI001573E4BF|nr:hypothetical protein [Agrobacterium tumefaciens]
MADGLTERIKKLLRPIYDFRPGFGMGPGRGGSFMSQEDFANKYPHIMPGHSMSASKPRWDELDTPANRKALARAEEDQEISMAYRMGQMIDAKQLKSLYEQGRGAKLEIDTGNSFSIEYDKMGRATHVTLDFGLGDVWRVREGFMREAISAHHGARAAQQQNTQQDRRDQIRAAVLAPVMASLRKAKTAENAEIYDFLSKADVANQPKEQAQPQEQQVRQVNVLKSHYISRDGNQTFENLANRPAALRGHPEDTGVSARLTQLAAIRDVLREEPEATVNTQSAALGQRGTSYYLTTDEKQLVQSTMVQEWDEEQEIHIDQPHERVFDVENLKEILTDQQGVEWKEVDALSDGFQPDRDQAALRLEVVERLREGDIESLNFEEEGVSFYLDGDKLVETWTNPDQAFAWDADKCDVPLYATDVQQTVEAQQQVAQEAPYELTEQDYLDMEEARAYAQAEEDRLEHQERERREPDYHAALEAREAREAYEQDRERSVQEQMQENIEAGVVEDTDLYADYDRQAVEHDRAWESEEAYELQHAERSEVLYEARDREVFELYREAEYQHSEWKAGERDEAVDLSVAPEGVTEREWARAASDFKEWEQEYEQNRQEPTIDEVIQLDNASAEDDQRREHELVLSNQLAHLRMPDGGTFVQHVRERHEQGHETTKLGDVEYRIDGNDLVSRHGSEELRGDAGMVDFMIAERHKQADQFMSSLQSTQTQTVSAVETQNQSELLNTQKTNDNQPEQIAEHQQRRGSLAEFAENAVARDGSEFSMTDIRDYARNKREESGQPLSPQSRAIQEQLQEHEAQSQSQKLTNTQRH